MDFSLPSNYPSAISTMFILLCLLNTIMPYYFNNITWNNV